MTNVIILNASYEPHDVKPLKHAIQMLVRKVAVVEEFIEGRTIGPYPWPRVLRLVRYVPAGWRYNRRVQFSRRAVLRRDRYRCAYCGGYGDTVDHVLPQCQGGLTTWLNLVAACSACNGEKDGRTPEQAEMRLLYQPFIPTGAQMAA